MRRPRLLVAVLACLLVGAVGAPGASAAPTITGCTTTEQAALEADVLAARSYIDGAVAYLAAGTAGARYQYWFGAYDATRWGTVQTTYARLKALYDGAPLLDCDPSGGNCAAGVYAWTPVVVSTALPIHLCPPYFSAPATGVDSRPGTLIHEATHYTDILNAQDNAYGQAPSHALAGPTPELAVRNADSYEYFAENAPDRSARTATVAPSANDFGAVTVGTTSGAVTVTATSTGDGPIAFSSVLVSGPFAVTADTCSGQSIAPGATCAVSVAFAPTAAVAVAGGIALVSNATAEIGAIALSGTGTAAAAATPAKGPVLRLRTAKGALLVALPKGAKGPTTFRVQRLRGTKWVTVGRAYTLTSGTRKVGAKPGRYRVVTVATATVSASTSATVTVRR